MNKKNQKIGLGLFIGGVVICAISSMIEDKNTNKEENKNNANLMTLGRAMAFIGVGYWFCATVNKI